MVGKARISPSGRASSFEHISSSSFPSYRLLAQQQQQQRQRKAQASIRETFFDLSEAIFRHQHQHQQSLYTAGEQSKCSDADSSELLVQGLLQ